MVPGWGFKQVNNVMQIRINLAMEDGGDLEFLVDWSPTFGWVVGRGVVSQFQFQSLFVLGRARERSPCSTYLLTKKESYPISSLGKIRIFDFGCTESVYLCHKLTVRPNLLFCVGHN